MSKRALRFASEADMPPSMRALYRSSEQTKVQAAVVVTKPQGTNIAAKVARRKYGNHITHVDGIRFDSRREAKYYQNLQLRIAGGEVKYFLRQVPIHLPGGTKLVVDFQEFHTDGSVHYVDVKGRETPVFRLKKREVEHHYPIKIELA
jgi:uncharacterized protein DUF1064